MATHSSTLAWKVPWMEEPGRLQSMESLGVKTWLRDFTFTFYFHALEKEMATHSSILAWRIPGMGEPGGLLSMGSHRVRHDWSDLAAAEATTAHPRGNTMRWVTGSMCITLKLQISQVCIWSQIFHVTPLFATQGSLIFFPSALTHHRCTHTYTQSQVLCFPL